MGELPLIVDHLKHTPQITQPFNVRFLRTFVFSLVLLGLRSENISRQTKVKKILVSFLCTWEYICAMRYAAVDTLSRTRGAKMRGTPI